MKNSCENWFQRDVVLGKMNDRNIICNSLSFSTPQDQLDHVGELLLAYKQEIRQAVKEKTSRLEEELRNCKNQLRLAQEAEETLRKKNIALRRMATRDGLTEISNRRHFDECLEVEWRRMMKAHQPIALIFCDVDYFKRYNDTYGHQMGDYCLKKVAQTMDQVARRTGTLVARYGGEEFVFLLSNTDSDTAVVFAQKVQVAIQELKLPHRDSDVGSTVTLSMGVSSFVPDRKTAPERLLALADQALYDAKKAGRDRIVRI